MIKTLVNLIALPFRVVIGATKLSKDIVLASIQTIVLIGRTLKASVMFHIKLIKGSGQVIQMIRNGEFGKLLLSLVSLWLFIAMLYFSIRVMTFFISGGEVPLFPF